MKYTISKYEILAWFCALLGFILFCFDRFLFSVLAFGLASFFLTVDYTIFSDNVRKIFKK
jgi:hypothetical protein